MTDTSRTLLVAGHGMAGHRLVSELRRLDPEGRWRVLAVTEESHGGYDRVALTSHLTGNAARDLNLVEPALREDPLVELRTRVRISRVDPGRRLAHCADGTAIGYDALVLATGSRPFVPPVPGHDLPGCFVYRTLEDLDALRAAARPGEAAVVVGGGLLGLEAADGLRHLGMRPHVVELAPHLMPLQVDAAGGALLARLVRDLGVGVHCGTGLRALHAGGDGRVDRASLDDGTELAARVVVFAAGVRPRDELAAEIGAQRGDRGGILVDGLCRTGVPGVWAIGECAALEGRVHGLAAPGYRMAESVARQLAAAEAASEAGAGIATGDGSTRLKLLGVEVASFGDAHAASPGAMSYACGAPGTGPYAKLVLGDGGRVLLGGVLVGDASGFPLLSALVGRELPAEPELLLLAP